MANRIKLKKSVVASRAPTVNDLEYGELAINYNDGRLYFKKSDGVTPANDTVQSFSSSNNFTNVTGGIQTPDYIDFNTSATVTSASGRLWWDNADGNQTLSLGMAGGNVVQQIGQETYFRIKASSAITQGQVVMFTGTLGASGALTGAPATGLTANTGIYVMGVATENIALNEWGYVTAFGLVRGIDTTGGAEAWTDGTILYFDPSVAGGLTKNIPVAPNPKVVVAVVVHAATNGSIFVRVSHGSVLGGTDGNVQFGTLADGDRIIYNGTNQRWENYPANGSNIDQLTSISKSLTLTTDWQDTGISGTDLATGTYIIQLFANDAPGGGTNNNEYYSGTMSWYSGPTNSSTEMPTDEIPLHRAGGSGEGELYLRTYRTPGGVLKLQVFANVANASASNYVFKFRRMI